MEEAKIKVNIIVPINKCTYYLFFNFISMKPKRKTVKDFIKIKHKVFTDDNIEWSVTTQEKDIHLLLQILPEHRIITEHYVKIANRMAVRGAHVATEGTYLCLDGDIGKGWYLIRKSLIYRFLISYICFPIWDKQKDIKRRPSELAYYVDIVSSMVNIAGLGLIISPNEGDWMLDQMKLGLIDERCGWRYDDFYGAYLVRLYQMLKGESDIPVYPPNSRKNWCHPYEKIFDNWKDEKGLATAIYDMCEYHMYANNKDWDNHNAEFGDLFAGLNPIEVHVLEYVRGQLGLSTPKVEHELLQPPFYPIPDSVKNISTEQIIAEDQLLHDVVEFINDWVKYPL
jgi:hypothetical protein